MYVKVGGKVLPLEPSREIKLKPGKHKVEFRVSDDEPWTPTKSIEVAPGKRYFVQMSKPAGLTIKPL